MEDRLKWLALVGAGALIGSVSTIALLKFLNRGVEDQGCSSKSTESNAERECFTNGILRMNGEDLLKDEIVSEQLTSDTSVNNKGMMNGKYDNRAGVVESLKFPMAKEYLSPSKIRTKGEQFLFGGGSSYHHGLIRNQKEDYLVGGGGMHRTDRVEKFVCLGGGSCCWKNKYQEGPKEFRVCSRARNIQFFGLECQQKVAKSYVVVIGLGGVGSHAASMLLRSGVGRLLLVDFDQVSLSSLNRHAVATREDVGTPKALCLRKHLSSIFPECQIDARVMLYDASTEEEILSGHPDFVLDCIDNIDTKVALLASCARRGLRVLSATGAGARADPTRVRVADLRESTNDPLSRAVRHRLRRDYGIEGGIPVVFSFEKPKVKLLPFKGSSGGEENPSDYQIVPGFRVRIIPVLGYIPAIFGQVMASYVVTKLAGLQVETEPVVNFDLDHYRIFHQRLIEHEELVYGTASEVEVDVQEVMYVAKELWHGRSARDLSLKDVGHAMRRSVNELMLVRWDCAKPASVSNLILLNFNEASEHESRTLDEIRDKEPEFVVRVTAILKRAESDFCL